MQHTQRVVLFSIIIISKFVNSNELEMAFSEFENLLKELDSEENTDYSDASIFSDESSINSVEDGSIFDIFEETDTTTPKTTTTLQPTTSTQLINILTAKVTTTPTTTRPIFTTTQKVQNNFASLSQIRQRQIMSNLLKSDGYLNTEKFRCMILYESLLLSDFPDNVILEIIRECYKTAKLKAPRLNPGRDKRRLITTTKPPVLATTTKATDNNQITLPKFSGLKFEEVKQEILTTQPPKLTTTTPVNFMDSLRLYNILQHGKKIFKSIQSLNKLPKEEIDKRNRPVSVNFLLNNLRHVLDQDKLTIIGICIAPENYGLTIAEVHSIFKINVRYIRSLFTPINYRKPCAVGDDAFNLRPDQGLCEKLGCIYQPSINFTDPWCFADTTRQFYFQLYGTGPVHQLTPILKSVLLSVPSFQNLQGFLQAKQQIYNQERGLKLFKHNPMQEFFIRQQIQKNKEWVKNFKTSDLVVKVDDISREQANFQKHQYNCGRWRPDHHTMMPCMTNSETFNNVSACHEKRCCLKLDWNRADSNLFEVDAQPICFRQKTHRDYCNAVPFSRRTNTCKRNLGKFDIKQVHAARQACERRRCCFDEQQHKLKVDNLDKQANWCFMK